MYTNHCPVAGHPALQCDIPRYVLTHQRKLQGWVGAQHMQAVFLAFPVHAERDVIPDHSPLLGQHLGCDVAAETGIRDDVFC